MLVCPWKLLVLNGAAMYTGHYAARGVWVRTLLGHRAVLQAQGTDRPPHPTCLHQEENGGAQPVCGTSPGQLCTWPPLMMAD